MSVGDQFSHIMSFTPFVIMPPEFYKDENREYFGMHYILNWIYMGITQAIKSTLWSSTLTL